MVEFVLVFPVLALLLFAVVQFGIVFHNYVTLTDAVRAGSRQAAVGRHLAEPKIAAEERVRESAANLDQAKLDVDVQVPAVWLPGEDVTVEASYPYSINLLGIVVASGDLTSKTTERVE
ncbi:MAG: TadE/TadG family type IV pilus assembly protein [Gaiellaceae bacterium]